MKGHYLAKSNSSYSGIGGCKPRTNRSALLNMQILYCWCICFVLLRMPIFHDVSGALSYLVHNSNWRGNKLYVRRFKLSSQLGLPLVQFPRLPRRWLGRMSKECGCGRSHCAEGKSFGGFATKLRNTRVTLMQGTDGTWVSRSLLNSTRRCRKTLEIISYLQNAR